MCGRGGTDDRDGFVSTSQKAHNATVISQICQVFSPQTSSQVRQILNQYFVRFVFLCTLFLTSFSHFLFLCVGLLTRDERHSLLRSLTASCTGAEHTRYSGVSSTLKQCVQCNFSAERVRRGATEWSDKAVGRLGGVWGPLRHCNACKPSRMSCNNAAFHL